MSSHATALRTVIATLGLAAGLVVLGPASAHAATDCDLVAAPSGSDSNPGTLAEPLKSANKLVESLQPGQTACLREGVYETVNEDLWIKTSQTTLTSYNGERAEVRGHFAIDRDASGVTVEDLVLNGKNSRREASPFIGGPNATFRNNEVTNDHTAICFLLTGQGGKEYYVDDALIEDNRIHNCGKLPAGNHDHGIYIQRTRNAIVRNNVIYDNADRGIQLYYDAQNTEIYGNVIDGNGQGIIISGDKGYASNGTRVHNNVIANSILRYNVEEHYPSGNTIGKDNKVYDNCLYSSGGKYGGVGGNSGLMPEAKGFTANNNVFVEPSYADREQGALGSNACSAVLGGGGPGGQSPGGQPPSAGTVTLEVNKDEQRAGKAVKLTGSAPATSPTATILRKKGGNWKVSARAQLRNDGSFKVRRTVRRGSKRLKFRASVPSVGTSNTVQVKVKKRKRGKRKRR